MTVHHYCHHCDKAIGMNGPQGGSLNEGAQWIKDPLEGRMYAVCEECTEEETQKEYVQQRIDKAIEAIQGFIMSYPGHNPHSATLREHSALLREVREGLSFGLLGSEEARQEVNRINNQMQDKALQSD